MLLPLGVVYVSGCVYAVGGFNGSLRVRTVDCYDPMMDRWTSVSSMQDRRSTLGAAVLNGLLYAVGGFDGSTGTAKMISEAKTLNPYRLLYVYVIACGVFDTCSVCVYRFVDNRGVQRQDRRVVPCVTHEYQTKQCRSGCCQW